MIINADILDWAKTYKGPKFHAVLCDPPYGLGFMGKELDTFKSEYLKKKRESDEKRAPRNDGRTVASWGNAADAGTYDLSKKGLAGYQYWCKEWAEAIKPHPTLSETVMEAALDWSDLVIHSPK